MDAANISLKKTALLVSLALLIAAPFRAQAQSFFFPNGQTVTMNGNQPACLEVDSSGGSITYNAAQVAAVGDGNPRFAISPQNPVTTNGQLCFSLFNLGGVTPGNKQITINLTPTTNTITASTVTVNWNPNTGGGGGGNTGSGLSANTTSLGMTSFQGSVGQSTFTLSNATTQTINFSIAANYSQGSGWLTFPTGNQAIAGNSSASVTVYGNPAGLSNTVYNANLVISYNGAAATSGTITLPVQFSVGSNTGGGGNGNLVANPNPVNLNYNTGSNIGPSQQVTLTTSASTYDASVTSGTSWLLVNGNSSVFGVSVSSGLAITTILSNLPTANATGNIQVTDSFGNVTNIAVNLTINGTTNGLSISPSPVTINAAVGQSTSSQTTATITSTAGGTLAISNTTGTGISATLAASSITAGGSVQMVVYGNPAGLTQNTYQGSVTVTLNNTTSTTVNVNFVVGTGSGGNSGIVAPTSLQFNYQVGQASSGTSSTLPPQFITEGVSGSFTTSTPTASWLTVAPSTGTGPSLITVTANSNVSTLSAGQYSATFNVTTSAGTQTVTANLLVSTNTIVFANPPVLNLSYTGGSPNPTTTFQVLSSDGSSIALTGSSSQSWLTVQQLNTTTPATFYLTINAASLPNGVNVGTVGVGSNAANTSLNVPIVVTVTGSTSNGSGSLTLGQSSLSFSAPVNGSAPNSQPLTVTASTSTSYTANASGQYGNITWLSISPSGSLNTSSTSSISVSVNQAGLPTGTYNGNIALTTSSGTQNVPVTLVVSAANSGNIQADQTSLSFNSQMGGSAPGTQTINVSPVNSSSASFTVGVSTQSGGSWLSTNIPAGQSIVAPFPVVVSVNPASLAAGTYTGSVILTGANSITVSVTLVVQGLPTVSASPSTLTFTYIAGSSNTPSSTIAVTGSAANLNFTAAANSSGWLSVTPTSGSTGANGASLNVAVNPAGLAAGPYNGTITVTGTNGATGTSTIAVTLTVTAPLPTISAVTNAASGSTGPVAPGEIVSIFAPTANPIGPATPVTLTLDTNGNVSTTLGGVQVLFNGIPAPLIFVSSTQINAVVPYQIAGLFAPFVQVKYLGQSSNSFPLTTASTAPGIFTQNLSGTGPGAILNQDFSVNAANRPAAKGSVVQVYMTGEGATSPAGVTGKVNCPSGQSCSVSQLPVPLLPVTVTLIDSNGTRYPANYIYAGAAPGFVSGFAQVNVVLPTNIPSGNLQIVISVGSNSSQAGVTVAVQ